MTYEELICTLRDYCLNNVPTNYNSIINTVKSSKGMKIVFDTVGWDIEGDSYCIYFGKNKESIFLDNIYRIDIELKERNKSASIILKMLNEKEYKILFISQRISSCYGMSCNDIVRYFREGDY